jgi:hypothetical protein
MTQMWPAAFIYFVYKAFLEFFCFCFDWVIFRQGLAM